MFRKMLLPTVIATFIVGFFLLVPGGTSPALAQDGAVAEDTNCRTCHEDRYFLHDSGKWYCLNETRVSCMGCHGGNPGAVTKEAAHEGLIARPLANDAAVCQGCHPEDYQERVQIYAAVAGVRPTPRPYSAYTPPTTASTSGEGAGGSKLLRDYLPGAWEAAGLLFLGSLFAGLFLFSTRGVKMG